MTYPTPQRRLCKVDESQRRKSRLLACRKQMINS